ncbi:MAG: 50S ribosomal protein L13 [Candidatus Pacearchaeota archaeon]
MSEKIVVDGENTVFGRMASVVAKELLKGNFVNVINSEKVLISGKKDDYIKRINAKIKMGKGASLKGPKYIREEDRILKRMIRGMLPRDRTRGVEAFKRLKCYKGIGELTAEELKETRKIECNIPHKYFTVEKLVRGLR